MSDKLITLEIITPEKIIFSKKVKSVTVPGESGSFQVLFNHAPILSNLTIGTIKFVNEDGTEEFMSTSGGFVSVEKNKMVILAETIEKAIEIDISRAEDSLNRAEIRVKSSLGEVDKERATSSIERAKNRIKVASKINQ